MAKPMFFYTGAYNNAADADADYAAIESLHKGDAIGSYDSAVIVHTPDGEVKVTKTEKLTKKGAWIGLAAGAGAAVVFPFLLPAVSYAGMAGARRRTRRVVRTFGARNQPRRGQGHRLAARAGQGRADRHRHRQGRRQVERLSPARRGALERAVGGWDEASRRPSRRWNARRPDDELTAANSRTFPARCARLGRRGDVLVEERDFDGTDDHCLTHIRVEGVAAQTLSAT